MRLETLRDRIENATTKIEKKGNTISKKTVLISKKEAKLEKMGYKKDVDPINCKGDSEAWELAWSIRNLQDDIKRLTSEIEEVKVKLDTYNKQMEGELEKESILIKEVPESMKRMQEELVKQWNEWDINHREFLKKEYKELGYDEFIKKHGWRSREEMYITDDQIQKSNEQDAKVMIINLYYRVKKITGEVTNWSGIRCEAGNLGAVLTGYVIGKEGRAEVETILAGGYNIQRLHVRTLVHER